MASASIYDPYGGDEAAPLVEKRFLDFLKNYQDAEEPVPEWDEMDHHSLLYNPSANKVSGYGCRLVDRWCRSTSPLALATSTSRMQSRVH